MDFVETRSSAVKAVEDAITKLSPSSPLLLLGEAGSGKRTLVRRIQEGSGRWRGELTVVNCSGLTEEDFNRQKECTLTRGGTLYLAEIADLSPSCQLSLLHLLTQAQSTGNGKAQARLICASPRNLEAAAHSGQFHEELYYRISAVCLQLPPLRHRREDVAPLMEFFLSRFAADLNRPVPQLSRETRQLFLDYQWPGNIRELADMAKAVVVLGDETLAMSGLRVMLSAQNHERTSLREAARAASREAEREMILRVLARTRWNRRRAAQELKISYKALLYKLKQIGDSQASEARRIYEG